MKITRFIQDQVENRMVAGKVVIILGPRQAGKTTLIREIIAKEKEIYTEQEASSGKPAHIVERIIEGKIEKWYSENCLLEQGFVRDPEKTIQSMLTDNIATLGENIQVSRFERLAIGE